VSYCCFKGSSVSGCAMESLAKTAPDLSRMGLDLSDGTEVKVFLVVRGLLSDDLQKLDLKFKDEVRNF
jgi:hypothetical protein